MLQKNNFRLPCLLIPLFLLLSIATHAQRFETVGPGYWSDTAVWANGNIPEANFYDTVLVRHPVIFEEDLFAHNYFLIEEHGVICGHHNVTVDHPMDVFGFFRLDSLIIISTDVLYSSSAPGNATYYVHLSGPSSFTAINHQGFSVGPWFDCRDVLTLGLPSENQESALKCYPNPVKDLLLLKGDLNETQLLLFDMQGKLVLEKKSSALLDVSTLDAGIYCLQVIKQGSLLHHEKIIVLHE